MPKVKTHSRAKKTFTVSANGKIRRRKAFRKHLLTKKSAKRRRRLDGSVFLHAANVPLVKRMLNLR
jgi:large subunit ribosomal protein L35